MTILAYIIHYQCGDKFPTAVNAPPCPPLILEGELVSLHAASIRWCHCAQLLLRWYPTPPLRLEGGRGGVDRCQAFITILIKKTIS